MSKEMLFLCDVYDAWLDENDLPHRSADDILSVSYTHLTLPTTIAV